MTTERPPSEPSMDEILASIRQIISDDPRSESKSILNPYDGANDEDILDLTHLLPDEEPFFAKGKEKKSFSLEKQEEPSLLKKDKVGPSSIPSPQGQKDKPALPLEDLLVSQATAFEAVQSLQALRTLPKDSYSAEPKEEVGGQAIENLVREILKPLLKEWLDANLPSLVRWIVTEQVEKIVRQGTSFPHNQDN